MMINNEPASSTMNKYELSFQGKGESLEIEALTKASGGQKIHVDKLTGLVFAREQNNAEKTAMRWSEEVYIGKETLGANYTGMIPIMKARHHFVAETLEQTLPGGIKTKKICDIGAGEGYFLAVVKYSYGADVLGVEPSEENCRLLKKQGIPSYHGICENVLNDHEELRGSFDIVTLNWTLCNCANCWDAMNVAKELVKDGGYIAVCDSSRILTPFKKSLSLWMQPDEEVSLHPWFFSFNTIRCLMATVEIDPIFQNNHHEQNDLLTIGRKVTKGEQRPKPEEYIDKYQDVINFFERWEKDSANYQVRDAGGYNRLE